MWLYKLQSTRLLRGVLGFFVDIDPLQAVSVGLYGNRELSTVFSSLISAISAISAISDRRAFLAISAISAFHICPGFEADMPRSEVTFDNPDYNYHKEPSILMLTVHYFKCGAEYRLLGTWYTFEARSAAHGCGWSSCATLLTENNKFRQKTLFLSVGCKLLATQPVLRAK